MTISATTTSAGVTAPGAVTLTITDDESLPKVVLLMDGVAGESCRMDENVGGSIAIGARLSGAASEQVTVEVAASPSQGYTLSQNTMLTIAAGQTESAPAS